MAKRAAIYARVSTTRQAEHDLSIPDQRAQAQRYCADHGFEVVREFIEPGASATTDKRPIFQDMIAFACRSDRPLDAVIVHSLSRFARDAIDAGIYERKLEKNGVKLLSVTQAFADDPNGTMMKQIIAAVDQHQSAENAKHTLRAMMENARNGFWNGSRPPYGYKTYEAERRADKSKRKLAIEDHEAKIVKLAFKLYLHGDGRSGPMGIKAIVNYLNGKGLRHRTGGGFSVQVVQQMLRRTTYMGTHFFNKLDSRTRRLKPRDEWVEMPSPVIIDEEAFIAVQNRLARNHPKTTPPRSVNSPVLLTGLAHCGDCGGPMRLRTGKSGKYRYYTCGKKADLGATACKGRTVPMGLLDDLVAEQLCDKVLEPERLRKVTAALVSRSSSAKERLLQESKRLKGEKRKADEKINRLFEGVEDGYIELTPSFRKRQAKHEQDRDQLIRLIALNERQLDQPIKPIAQSSLDAFSKAMRAQITGGSTPFRKAYLRLFIDRIDVGEDEIRISGSDLALMAAAQQQKNTAEPVVPTFAQEWCGWRESNPHSLARTRF